MKKKIIVLLSFMACITMTACTSTKTRTSGSGENVQSSETNVQSSETDAQQTEETTKPAETVYNIGDSITLADWGIVVTELKVVESIAANYGTFSPNEAGNKFAQVFVTVTNNGKQADNFMPIVSMSDDVSVKLLYGDGYEFSSTNLLGYDNDMHNSNLNPLSSKSGEIAFEIPDSVASSGDELLLQFKSGNDEVKVKIR